MKIEYVLCGLCPSLNIVGGYLMATKILAINTSSIIKKCVGYELLLEKNKTAFVYKHTFMDFFRENLYALIGFIYMLLSQIISIFYENNVTNKLLLIIYIILEIFLVSLITYGFAKIICKYKSNKIPDKVVVSNKLIENGAIAAEWEE